MATIIIKDLTESTELDRQAMLAIAGGSRIRTGAAGPLRSRPQKIRLFDPAAGSAAKQAAARPPSQ